MGTQVKFARFCNATNQGMDAGFVFNDGLYYCSTEEAALAYAKSLGYKDLQESYDDDVSYYTHWDADDEEYWYECRDGKWYEVDADGNAEFCEHIQFDQLPEDVIKLFFKEQFDYSELEVIKEMAENIYGYTFEYGLDASPYNFRKL